ncbi:MAG: DUF423 domain-containing protein [Alphaproteobacteria bacterium]|nr:DUF423 domain-containing protein [Alphaproteobacteria bacterium]
MTAWGAFLISAAVALGAVGAHAVGAGDAVARQLWQTANLWHAISAVGLFAAGLGWARLSGPWRGIGTGLVSLGVVLFSGSIYLQALTGSAPFPGSAPLGGSALILGWLMVAVAALRAARHP